MKLSDYVFEFIAQKDIDTVFTVSGGGCMHLIDSLGRNKRLRYVCNHHEQACAMAAEAYFRTKNKPGCILVTTGPGGTNALTGVLCAYQDSIPMIVISGQVQVHQMSKGTGCRQIGQQEFNIVDTVKTMTKYAVTVTEPSSILYHLQKAYSIATTGRPGPVWIDIPLDVQASEVIGKLTEYDDGYKFKPTKTIDRINLRRFKKALMESRRPVVVIGNGIKSSNTKYALLKFLKDSKLPVMTGPHSAVDVVNTDYEVYSGRFGLLGQRSSNTLIQESDLVISLGSRLNPKMIGYDASKFAPNAKKIIVDVDANELKKLKLKNAIMWNIDLKDFFEMIQTIDYPWVWWTTWRNRIRLLRNSDRGVPGRYWELKDYVSTYVFANKLEWKLKDDSIIVTSNGTAHVIPLKTISLRRQQQMFSNEGTAPMGYGLPAAIGAHYGSNKEIICIEGDGSIMMNLQELETIRHNNLPLKIFVLNNQGYLSIRLTQNSFFKGNIVASDATSGVSIPSFKAIAKAFGIKYYSMKNNSEVSKVLDKAFKQRLCIVEVFTDPNEKHEPKVVAKGVDSNGKIIPGELTDMSD